MWPLSRFRRERHLTSSGTSTPSSQGLWGLEHMLSKHQHLWPAAPPPQYKCLHHRCHSGLPGRKSHSAGRPPHVCPELSPLWFLSVLSNEALVEREAVSGRWRCSSLLCGREFWHTFVNKVWHHVHVLWKDNKVCACWGGVTMKNLTRQEICTCTQIATLTNLWGDPGSLNFWEHHTHLRHHHHSNNIALFKIGVYSFLNSLFSADGCFQSTAAAAVRVGVTSSPSSRWGVAATGRHDLRSMVIWATSTLSPSLVYSWKQNETCTMPSSMLVSTPFWQFFLCDVIFSLVSSVLSLFLVIVFFFVCVIILLFVKV